MRDRDRHVASLLVLAFFLALNTATSKSHSGHGPPPLASLVDATPVVVAPIDAGSSLTDYDRAAAEVAGGCAKNKSSDVCRLLGEFGKAARPADLPALGQDIWVGWTYSAEGARAPFFLKIQRGYTPSPLPHLEAEVMEVSAVWQVLRPELAPETDSSALIAAAKGGATAPAKNRAAEHARGFSPNDYFAMVRTRESSIAILDGPSPPHAFLRAFGSKLILIEHAITKPLAHDKTTSAIFASELWRLK